MAPIGSTVLYRDDERWVRRLAGSKPTVHHVQRASSYPLQRLSPGACIAPVPSPGTSPFRAMCQGSVEEEVSDDEDEKRNAEKPADDVLAHDDLLLKCRNAKRRSDSPILRKDDDPVWRRKTASARRARIPALPAVFARPRISATGVGSSRQADATGSGGTSMFSRRSYVTASTISGAACLRAPVAVAPPSGTHRRPR